MRTYRIEAMINGKPETHDIEVPNFVTLEKLTEHSKGAEEQANAAMAHLGVVGKVVRITEVTKSEVH